ncbi:MAG: phosphotransferase [Pseudomonadota bacterium]
MSREEDIRSFLTTAHWAHATRAPLAGDASNRRYERLQLADDRRAVLMDAPPDTGEDIGPFIKIAQFLTQAGLSAPKVFEQDSAKGFLLIEDLGDRLFSTEIAGAPECEPDLYAAAIDVLTALHKTNAPHLAFYDAQTTVPLAALAFDWYQSGTLGTVSHTTRQQFSKALENSLSPFDNSLDVLIQRDYHAENLLWLPERSGVARVGLLDFQDAMIGHRSYDLVSVLQDARRDVPLTVEAQMKSRFIAQNQLDAASFETAYAAFGLQRNLRILGVFARLCMRDGKAQYIDFIPRVWGFIERNLSHASLIHLAPLVLGALPAPTPDVLKQLKARRGSCAGR